MTNLRSELEKEIKNFRALQHELGNFGATDTEPREVFAIMCINAFMGHDYEVPCAPGYPGWCLFTDEPGAEGAGWRMHDAAKRVVDLIEEMVWAANEARDVLEREFGGF